MKEPDYVLKFDESILVTEHKGMWSVIQKVCIAAFLVIIVGSLVLQTNLLGELSAYAIFIFVALFIASFFNQKSVWVPSPIELRFYPDRLVVYREKCVYSEKMARKEWIEMYYADTTRFVLRTSSKRLSVSGKMHSIYNKYNKDGTLPEKPYHDRVADAGYTINLHFIEDLDIVKEIETHSPLKVTLENS